MRRQMEEARARALQPHYVRGFFLEAFRCSAAGSAEREPGRYEITHVPAVLRDRDRQVGLAAPVLRRYERVCFDREHVRPPGRPGADLLAPGHPLLDAVVDLVIERYGTLLKQGASWSTGNDPGEEPRLLVALTQQIVDGHTRPGRSRSGSSSSRSAATGRPAPPARHRTLTTGSARRPESGRWRDLLQAEPWLAAGRRGARHRAGRWSTA